jgi:hypothetical protein
MWMHRAGLLSLAIALPGCWSYDEVARVAHLDSPLEAVVVEGNGGATTSFSYDIYVVEEGRPYRRGDMVAGLYGAVRSSSAYGVNLHWVGDTLRIEYLSARQDTLFRSMLERSGRRISVQLAPGIVDSTAPSGGMLYQLRKEKATN